MEEAVEFEDKALNNILRDVIATIESSKSQIFDIYESACLEVENSKNDLAQIKKRVHEIIERVDTLKIEAQKQRQELARVSRAFSAYSESNIRRCYAAVEKAQVELAVATEQELQLRQQRDRAEQRLQHLSTTVNTAKHLAVQIGVVMGYLSSQLDEVVNQMESANKGKMVGERIIKAQENERLRLSREIHDGPAQTMANLIYQSSICERMLDIDVEGAKKDWQDLRQQIRGCLSEIRQIIFDLRPMSLDDLGLTAAVQQFLRKFKERSGIDVKFSIDGTPVPFNKYIEVSLFRIIQEALNNIYQHAETDEAEVVLRYNRDNLSLLISDQGLGFDADLQPEAVAPGGTPEHFGLIGMKERANIIKAQLIVDAKPGTGTKIRLLLPLENIV